MGIQRLSKTGWDSVLLFTLNLKEDLLDKLDNFTKDLLDKLDNFTKEDLLDKSDNFTKEFLIKTFYYNTNSVLYKNASTIDASFIIGMLNGRHWINCSTRVVFKEK